MIKVTILVFILLSTAFIWVRSQWARSKNTNEAKQIISDLQSGKYDVESYAEALNILIRSVALQQMLDYSFLKQQIEVLVGKAFLQKYTIQYATINKNGNGILIGEAKIKELVAGYHGNKEIDIHLPCWLYIKIDETNKKIDFKSTFPETKEHHFVLDDLADGLCKYLFK
jgi:hypothetical protein